MKTRWWMVALALSATPELHAQEPRPAPPTLVESPTVTLPDAAREAGVSGTVELVVTIDREGRVVDARVTRSPSPLLDEAAVALALAHRFSPATRAGVPVAARVRLAVDFHAPAPTTPGPAPSGGGSPPAGAALQVPADAAGAPPEAAPVTTEVGVRGRRAELESPRSRVSREELRTMPGAGGDPLRAVTVLPGIARTPAFTDLLIVRGSAPSGTGVFFDGAYLPRAFHFGGLSSVVPTELLERIEFYPGNFPARYGRHDGGVLELRSRALDAPRPRVMAQVDLLDARAMVEAPLPWGARIVAAARRSWLDAWLGPVLEKNDVGVRRVPVYEDAQVFVEVSPSRGATLRAGLLYARDTFDLVTKRPLADEPAFAGGMSTDSGFWRAILRFDGEPTARARVSTMVSIGPDLQRERLGTLLVDSRIDYLSGRGEATWDATSWLALRAGWDVLLGTYDATLRIPSLPVIGGGEPPPITSQRPNTWRGSGTLSRPGAYAEARVTPVERWQVVPSVRADHTAEFGEWTVSPRLSSRLELRRGPARTAVRAGLGVFHQPPDYNAVIPIFGVPTLASSRAVHASVGVEQGLGHGADASVEAFHKSISGIPSHDPSRGPVATNANGAQGRVIGAEARLQLRGGGRVTGMIAYTLSRSTRRDAPGAPTRLFEYDQTHVLSAVARVRVGRGVTLGARYRAATGVPYTPCLGGSLAADAGVFTCVQGEPYGARLPAFHQLDLRIDKTWERETWNLTAYLDVQNVTNRSNAEGASYSFDKSKVTWQAGLPILPIAGVRVEL
ncbi:MAG: TonB-dependent receptor [Polyangiaceae bacterium]|nr:TonB-dependent receptor [Polyangiaceae bacterium]